MYEVLNSYQNNRNQMAFWTLFSSIFLTHLAWSLALWDISPIKLYTCYYLLFTEMTRFQNIVKGAKHNASKGTKKSVFNERTDEASAAQYFQVRSWLEIFLYLTSPILFVLTGPYDCKSVVALYIYSFGLRSQCPSKFTSSQHCI